MNKLFLISTLLILGFLSCNKDELSEEEQLKVDIEIIEKYLTENNLEAEKTSSGLHYIINDQGNGDFPVSTDDVTVRYKGYFTDGKVFDESSQEGIRFNLQQVIKGWTEGIPKFKEGGEGVLLIPSKLGYGSQKRQGIPANSVLIFDVKLFIVHN